MQTDDQNIINEKWDELTDIAQNSIYGVVKQAQDHAYQLGLKRGEADALALEKQYAERLGRMAQLCDIVIPWVRERCQWECAPDEVMEAADEIMDYVDAVRP